MALENIEDLYRLSPVQRGCQGGGEPPAGVKLARGRDTYEGCHTYHPPEMRRAAG